MTKAYINPFAYAHVKPDPVLVILSPTASDKAEQAQHTSVCPARVAAYMLELYIGRKKKKFSPEVASYTCKDISL